MQEHIRIATYEINKGTFQEVADTAKTGMLRKFQEQPGFIRYGVADLGDKKCLSISLWETHDQAKAATPVAETWVKENLSDRVMLRSNFVGDLAFFQPERVTV
jgi:heme-degrading monooxygenase HmoA